MQYNHPLNVHLKALNAHILNRHTSENIYIFSVFSRDLDALNEQLRQTKERYGDAISAGSERQDSEMRLLRSQRNDLNVALETALAEKDSSHKRSLKALNDCYETERTRLTASSERDKKQYEDHVALLTVSHQIETERVLSALREDKGRELLALRDCHAVTLGQAMTAATATHRYWHDPLRNYSTRNCKR